MAAIDELVERIEDLERQVCVHVEMREQWTSTVNALNNLVAAMKGHAQLVAMQPSQEQVNELVTVVQTSTTRIQELIRSSVRDADRDVDDGVVSGVVLEPSLFSILVVDDEQLIHALLHELLVKVGYQVAVAESGAEAVEKCKDNLYDLILMDFRLGDMDGVEAMRRIREYQTESRVVFLTGDPAIEEIQATVLKEGADGFITKPFDLKEITDAVQHILQTKGA